MVTRKKPKKGVMPPALKAYWAKRRGAASKTKRASKRKRVSNPHANAFRLAIKKGKDTLYLLEAGDKFAKAGRFKWYSNTMGAKAAAQSLAKHYASLKGWTFYAVT